MAKPPPELRSTIDALRRRTEDRAVEHADEETIVAYARGLLSEPGGGELRAHLEHCPRCKSLAANALGAFGPAPRGEVAQPGEDELERGTLVDRYLILARVAAGGMGVVYAAHDPELDRKVALKLLRPDSAASTAERLRLIREARALARLSHPNVVNVFDVGGFRDRVFIAMELVEGVTLDRWWQEHARTLEARFEALLAAGRGLAAAHASGLVHRDFKPHNVMVARDGQVKVLDFGLARAMRDGAELSPGGAAPRLGLDGSATETGALMGTPAYMAPELHRGASADRRSDQYSFALVVRDALQAPPEAKPPAWLSAILARALAERPEDRYASVDAILSEISAHLARKRSRSWTAALLAIGVLAAGGGLLFGRASREPPCEGASAALAPVWNAKQCAAIERRLASAPNAAKLVTQELGAWAERWSHARVEACTATRVRAEQSEALMDLRIACLDRRLGDLRAVIASLGGSAPLPAAAAFDVLGGLRSVEPCADADALQALVPLPADRAQRAEVESIQSTLSEARAAIFSGRHGEAEQRIASVSARVEALAHPPLSAETAFLRAELEVKRGRYAPAQPLLEAAMWSALQARDDQTAAEAAVRLVYLHSRTGRWDEGLAWAERAKALVARTNDGLMAAHLHRNTALILSGKGELARAKSLMEEVIAERKRLLSPEDPKVAAAESDLGDLELDLGHDAVAIALQKHALATLLRAYGEHHPEVGYVENALARAYNVRGDYVPALESFERSGAVFAEVFGAEHEFVATSLHNQGFALENLDRFEEAKTRLERALELRTRAFGPLHHEVGETLNSLANTEHYLGHEARALELAEESHRVTQATMSDHLELAFPLELACRVLAHLGRTKEAQARCKEALKIVERTAGAESEPAGEVHATLGEALLAESRPRDALLELERARHIIEVAESTTTPDVARVLVAIGEAKAKLGACAEAQVPLERAMKILENAAGHSRERALAELALAECGWSEVAVRPRARVLAERAERALARAPEEHRAWDQARAWLAEHPPPR